VTIGAWLIKKISGKDAILYIVSQFIGALVAMEIVLSTVGLAKIATPTSIIATVAEALGAFLFTFGIAAVVFEKSQKEFSGVIIGGSLFLGIAIAALMGSTGVLNPAVALGIGSFNWAYVIGPVLGAIFGMQAGKYLVG
jgi:aquaporin Z